VNRIAVWHEVECGGYAADLDVWERLARAREGSILELGCGSGRVALHLARMGHRVWAVDAEPALLEVLRSRASAEGLTVHADVADIRALDLGADFGLVLAPMQVLQMLGGPVSRRRALQRAAGHLGPGGRVAAAILERPGSAIEAVGEAAIPDVREVDGWTYSSLAVTVRDDGDDLEIHRLRQAVSPDGALSEEEYTERLDALDAAGLEAEGAAVGLSPVTRLAVPATEGYLGSTVVVMESA
jgi:SAM-dependent methyltransferase